MSITASLVLPRDVVLVPAGRLARDIRASGAFQDDDFAITRPRLRAASKILDRDSARLVEEFRQPSTIVSAVLRYSRAERAEPEQVLESAFPMLRDLIAARLLVRDDDEEAAGIQPSLEPGAELTGFRIVRCVQALEDTEIFQARSQAGEPVALKLARRDAPGLRRTFEREARVLRLLDGEGAPRLLAEGWSDERPFLALEWCPGVPASPRAVAWSGAREDALERCIAIAETYSALHRRGVVHGDVHPGNVLLSGDEVRLVDFGLARLLGAEAGSLPPRGAVPFFIEPEYAASMRERRTPPPATEAGEQYAVAELVSLLMTGSHSLETSLEPDEMIRRIAEERPRPFAQRGAEPWPALEAVLARALSKSPGDRFASMADFARALRSAGARARGAVPDPALLERPMEEVLALARPGGTWSVTGCHASHFALASTKSRELAVEVASGRVTTAAQSAMYRAFPGQPSCSVNFGAAGLAHALYRLASVRGEPELLALADAWISRASRDRGEPKAFLDPEQGLSEREVGRCSLLHSESGLEVVRALVAHAAGDGLTREQAVASFLAGARQPWELLDLALGRAGTLLGCCMLHEAMPSPALREAGDGIFEELRERLQGYGAIEDRKAPLNLGVAHGWAGLLYALLRWCATSGRAVPETILPRLDELADLGEPTGRGRRWRWDWGASGAGTFMPGWCNGSAGYVFLWRLAHRLLGDARWLRLAEEAAWDAWEGGPGPANLCCGLAGRAYALLHVFRATGDPAWRERARRLGERAVRLGDPDGAHPGSLYKGEVGWALLGAELRAPEDARFPFFEEEGW